MPQTWGCADTRRIPDDKLPFMYVTRENWNNFSRKVAAKFRGSFHIGRSITFRKKLIMSEIYKILNENKVSSIYLFHAIVCVENFLRLLLRSCLKKFRHQGLAIVMFSSIALLNTADLLPLFFYQFSLPSSLLLWADFLFRPLSKSKTPRGVNNFRVPLVLVGLRRKKITSYVTTNRQARLCY